MAKKKTTVKGKTKIKKTDCSLLKRLPPGDSEEELFAKNTMVRFDFDTIPAKYHSEYPFARHDRFIYLGDIVQMTGHCIVVRTRDNVVFTCYHTSNFVALTEEEV